MFKVEDLPEQEQQELKQRQEIIKSCFDEAHLLSNVLHLDAGGTAAVASMVFQLKKKPE